MNDIFDDSLKAENQLPYSVHKKYKRENVKQRGKMQKIFPNNHTIMKEMRSKRK